MLPSSFLELFFGIMLTFRQHKEINCQLTMQCQFPLHSNNTFLLFSSHCSKTVQSIEIKDTTRFSWPDLTSCSFLVNMSPNPIIFSAIELKRNAKDFIHALSFVKRLDLRQYRIHERFFGVMKKYECSFHKEMLQYFFQ